MHRRPSSSAGRSDDLEAILATYARYDRERRDRLWDQSNAGFRRTVVESRRQIIGLLAEALRANGSRVLDVGCGTGEFAAEARMAELDCEWTGLDLRPDAIEEASARYPWARFITASADDMPLPDASVDIALAIVVFSSLPSGQMERGVAKEITRVVRPGGRLIWFDLRYSNPTNPAIHGITRRRLAALFASWDLSLHSTSLMPPVARRLGVLTPVLYPLFQAIPPLRSHLVGMLRRRADPQT